MNKLYVNANDMLLDSFQLAIEIHKSGFNPDFLVGIWRGGSAVGIAVQEGLEYFGVDTDHIAIRTSYEGPDSYSERLTSKKQIRVHGLDYILRRVEKHHSLLIVDDVYSTGKSIAAVLRRLSRKARRNLPGDIRIATVWYRPADDTSLAPDYYIHKTKDWLVLPHELAGMSEAEIGEHKPLVRELMADLPAECRKRSA